MILHFCLDKRDKLWFLYCSSIRLSNESKIATNDRKLGHRPKMKKPWFPHFFEPAQKSKNNDQVHKISYRLILQSYILKSKSLTSKNLPCENCMRILGIEEKVNLMNNRQREDFEQIEQSQNLPFIIKYLNPDLRNQTWEELIQNPEVWSKQAWVWEDWYLDMTEFALDPDNFFIDTSTDAQSEIPKSVASPRVPHHKKLKNLHSKQWIQNIAHSEERRKIIPIIRKRPVKIDTKLKVIPKPKKAKVWKPPIDDKRKKSVLAQQNSISEVVSSCSISSSTGTVNQMTNMKLKRPKQKSNFKVAPQKSFINYVCKSPLNASKSVRHQSLFEVARSPGTPAKSGIVLPEIKLKDSRPLSAVMHRQKLISQGDSIKSLNANSIIDAKSSEDIPRKPDIKNCNVLSSIKSDKKPPRRTFNRNIKGKVLS